MKVGSLVISLVDHPSYNDPKFSPPSSPIKKGEILTVRMISNSDGNTRINFEEKSVSKHINGEEMGWNVQKFREIEIPPSIEAEIEESIKEPVEI